MLTSAVFYIRTVVSRIGFRRQLRNGELYNRRMLDSISVVIEITRFRFSCRNAPYSVNISIARAYLRCLSMSFSPTFSSRAKLLL